MYKRHCNTNYYNSHELKQKLVNAMMLYTLSGRLDSV